MLQTAVDYNAIKKKATGEVLRYYRSFRSLIEAVCASVECRWLAQVRNHYKLMYECRIGTNSEVDMLIEADIWPDGEVVLRAYKPMGLYVSNPVMGECDKFELEEVKTNEQNGIETSTALL